MENEKTEKTEMEEMREAIIKYLKGPERDPNDRMQKEDLAGMMAFENAFGLYQGRRLREEDKKTRLLRLSILKDLGYISRNPSEGETKTYFEHRERYRECEAQRAAEIVRSAYSTYGSLSDYNIGQLERTMNNARAQIAELKRRLKRPLMEED